MRSKYEERERREKREGAKTEYNEVETMKMMLMEAAYGIKYIEKFHPVNQSSCWLNEKVKRESNYVFVSPYILLMVFTVTANCNQCR